MTANGLSFFIIMTAPLARLSCQITSALLFNSLSGEHHFELP
jgi:hypothetical protein